MSVRDSFRVPAVCRVIRAKTLDCEPRRELPVLLPKTFAHPPVEVTGTCY